MMLLRTLVLERNDEDAPVNGALLCGFADHANRVQLSRV